MSTGTDDFYARQAADYAAASEVSSIERLQAFLDRMPPAASILELGCGAGLDSAFMLAAGFDVTASDGSPEMAREAEHRIGRPVRVMPFDSSRIARPLTVSGPMPACCMCRAANLCRCSAVF